MTDSDTEGMDLTDEEAGCLVTYLAASHLRYHEWLEWGNVPNLGEQAFERLTEAAAALAETLFTRSGFLDEQMDIDSRLLFERAVS